MDTPQKKKHLAFWIAFPIGFLLIAALLIFYLDLANGPTVIFVLALGALIALAVTSILLLGKKMRWRLIPWGAFLLTLGVLIPLAKPSVEIFPAVTHANAVQTGELVLRDGKVRGVYSEDKEVEVYAGIPYAAPPVGELRWKEPVDPTPWEGVRDCTYFAPKSMQPDSNAINDTLVQIYAEKSWHPDYNMYPEQNKSEDSLYLNIWRPAKITEPLPILVYIHGGSLTNGSSAGLDYNGEAMAHNGVIMITIQYRLGVFGYFAHQSLADESPNHTTGNYGLLDQIKALEWVQENAAYFGGDKNKVTIAGESAGSSSVSAICVSPLAAGKFRYAIGESSSIVLERAPHTFRTLTNAKQTGEKIMKEQGCSTIEELRKVPAEKLVKTAYANSSMTLDGYALLAEMSPVEIYEAGLNNEQALLNGYNIKEADAFVIPLYLTSPTDKNNIKERLASTFGQEIANKIYEVYKEKIEKDAFTAFNEIISVYWFIHPHHRWSHFASANGEPVYRYHFTKENGYYGTYHSGEIIYCYGNLYRSRHGFAYDETDYALSKTMLGYWANFAKNGNPNGTGLPQWNAYDEQEGKVQELGLNVGPIDDDYLKLYPLIDEFIASGIVPNQN